MFASSRGWTGPPVMDPLPCDETPGSTAGTARVPTVAPKGEPGAPHGPLCSATGKAVLHWHPPTTARNGSFSRRAFLQGTAGCSVLLMTLPPVAALANFSTAPQAAVTAESWKDETFWDDGTGWI